MKLLMVGAGGVGGYFGARLVDAGRDVTFLARGTHLATMRQSGLLIESPRGDLNVLQIKAVEAVTDAGAPDLILLAVKLADTQAAIEAIKPAVRDSTVIASLQNGIDSETMLEEAFGRSRVLGGVARISATIKAPGVISHTSKGFASIELGELDGHQSARLAAIAEIMTAPGMEFVSSKDIRTAIWTKFVLLASLSAATTTSRVGIGRLREDPRSRAWITELIREVIAVAQAEGAAIDNSAAAATLALMDKMPPAMTASMTYDLLHNKPLELDWLSGAVSRLGDTHNIPTPAHRHAVGILSPHRLG